MQTLVDKRVLITGAASGIGKALAARFADERAALVLVDVNEPLLAQTAAELAQRGARVRTHVLDVTDVSRITGLAEAVHGESGPIDVLVNNAGLVFGGAFLDVPLAMTYAFLPDLIAGRDGHVVNLASASSFIGLPFGATYASSKWAVLGFSESLALELELQGHRQVHVTAICPSYVATGLFDGAKAPRTTRLLTAERVAALTVRAVLRNKPVVRTPWLANMTPFMKGVMPQRLFYRMAAVLGVNTSMLQWRGRR